MAHLPTCRQVCCSWQNGSEHLVPPLFSTTLRRPGFQVPRRFMARVAPKLKTSPYTIFALAESATSEEIKARYRELCLQWHPDRITKANSGTSKSSNITPELAKNRFIEINEAYQILADPVLRKRYQSLAQRRTMGGPTGYTMGQSTAFHSGDRFIYNDPYWKHRMATAGTPETTSAEAEKEMSSAQRAMHVIVGLCGLVALGHFVQVLSFAGEARDQHHYQAWVAYDDARAQALSAGNHKKSVERFLERKQEAEAKRARLKESGY
ncbi:DnaJ sub C member 21 [Dispira simplex]|nr:DnaJ sub C member 21 [Dispira simplex]